MFSTYLYIVILTYQSFYSVSNDAYNLLVKNVNDLVFLGHYETAKSTIYQIKKNTIFTNAEVENTTQLIMIKSKSDINRDGLMSDFENWDTNEIILYSIFLDKSEKKEEAKVILYRSIIDNPTSDTLIKFYELMKSESKNLQVNVSKKLSISILNQWNEDEALQLLELMKKNEKHLL